MVTTLALGGIAPIHIAHARGRITIITTADTGRGRGLILIRDGRLSRLWLRSPVLLMSMMEEIGGVEAGQEVRGIIRLISGWR